ncbi:MAG: galactokinase [Planctomycetes bacterium]|nr:galactokinase [Planctomycetota bacterium]
MDQAIPLTALVERATSAFQKRFGRPARYVVAAPGRVNLIGEHIDYNDGLVLPMAIDRYTVLAGDLAEGESACVYSRLMDEQHIIPLASGDVTGLPVWTRYLRGVFDAYREEGIYPKAFDAVVDSTVPLGGGLSSSAALEVATATLIETITGQSVTPVRKALLCQQAEHRSAGVPCGIMDQFSSVLCQAGHLMLLDCRSQETTMVPMTDPSIEVLIINSNVKHELTGGEYAKRRAQCEAAAQALRVPTLREASLAMLEEKKSELDALLYRRARHVITEINRTTATAAAIEAGRWADVGELMAASHASLRDDYEVSCPELDILVAAASELGIEQGLLGSRMTGGGFGGCTVSLVKTEATTKVAKEICKRYRRQTGVTAIAFATPPAQGATVLVSNRS